MIKHKYTNLVGIVVVVMMLVITAAFIYSPNWGVVSEAKEAEYVRTLFDTSQVHTIDIQVDKEDWQAMLDNASAEEYIMATVVIDGDTVSGVGIRPKGNSSLSQIASSDSDRYSFKVEFDHYSSKITYKGLDKLALNNISQDNTYMKDYITYQMMNAMGADAPLSSFIWVTVNGEDWGLYLAVEAIEESFAQRVYGNNYGEIYKPDTQDMNDVAKFQVNNDGEENQMVFVAGENPENGEGFEGIGLNGEFERFVDEDGNIDMEALQEAAENGEFEGFEIDTQGGDRFGGMNGMSSGVTLLQYIDDDPDSYSAIFENAVFKVSTADENRLIRAIQQLNENENIEAVVDVDEVIRYFVVHNFVLNSDSYTGSITHNYYLAENDGQLSMIAWDYNLAFGGMGGGMGGFNNQQSSSSPDSATTYINYPIDDPLLSGEMSDHPMLAWIFENEEYLQYYHEVYAEYVEYFNSGEFAKMYDEAIALISPYVEKDPTAFATYEEFLSGSSALKEFCLRRAESIEKQLSGEIGSTSAAQSESGYANFVDGSDIDISSMGSNSMGFGGRNQQNNNWNNNQGPVPETTQEEQTDPETSEAEGSDPGTIPGPGNFPGQTTDPETGEVPEIPEGENGQGNFPEQGQGGFPGQGQGQGNFPNQGQGNGPGINVSNPVGNGSSTSSSTVSLNALLLLGACVIVLAGGILFARKRRF